MRETHALRIQWNNVRERRDRKATITAKRHTQKLPTLPQELRVNRAASIHRDARTRLECNEGGNLLNRKNRRKRLQAATRAPSGDRAYRAWHLSRFSSFRPQ